MCVLFNFLNTCSLSLITSIGTKMIQEIASDKKAIKNGQKKIDHSIKYIYYIYIYYIYIFLKTMKEKKNERIERKEKEYIIK